MKICLAQLNAVIADLVGNVEKIKKAIDIAGKDNADLIVFPELAIPGYPPRDYLYQKSFIEAIQQGLKILENYSCKFPNLGIIVGSTINNNKPYGKNLYNAAILIQNGKTVFMHPKTLLPTYDVFDEHRYFDPAEGFEIYDFKGTKLGITICEDIWNPTGLWDESKQYPIDPIDELVKLGADIIINISASPFSINKEEKRYKVFQSHIKKAKIPLVYVNQVGANDNLIFDGKSLIFNKDAKLIKKFPGFKEHIETVDLNSQKNFPITITPKIEAVHDALILGIKDYANKCGFKRILVGLSGGIDSAVVATLAVKAIGAKNVLGITMPSTYSSQGSIDDSKMLSKNLGMKINTIEIEPLMKSYELSLAKYFKEKKPDTTEENLQARIRGTLLMAFSNKFNYLLLSTGNKSELAVGYCTLYGDMSGGLDVLADTPKTLVYELAKYINKDKELIPQETITKPPSAELRPDQKDQDSLPPYEILDAILFYSIDKKLSEKEIIAKGFDSNTVKWILRSVRHNEYKRRQAAPGLKVTSRAFGTGRRMPIASKFNIDF